MNRLDHRIPGQIGRTWSGHRLVIDVALADPVEVRGPNAPDSPSGCAVGPSTPTGPRPAASYGTSPTW
jgi:hypothetical protein